MSQWTHVCGCIRIDELPLPGINLKETIKSSFGKTCHYEDSEEKWEACNVPCGSEGSVQYAVTRTGNDHSLSWGLVYIWGDLRNYENVVEIYNWIKRACEHQMIRSCAVKVEVEYRKSYLIHNVETSDYKTEIVLVEL